MLEQINNLGIGPMGLGGRTTALRVFVEKAACHTAMRCCSGYSVLGRPKSSFPDEVVT
jgi:tartrate dehydratase alpha subunit/fumarate hydratase class I-like protein